MSGLLRKTAVLVLLAACAARAADISALVKDFERRGLGDAGASIVRIPDRAGIYSADATRPMAPASNQKILTAMFALERLGVDFEFTTRVSVLGDDLVIEGDGDPLLGDPVIAKREGRSIYAELDAWARAVRDRAGRRIEGDIIIARRFGAGRYRPRDWPARHHDDWYGAGAADLNFHDNCYDVTFEKKGSGISPSVSPSSRYIRVLDRTTRGSSHTWRLAVGRGESSVTISGTVRSASADPISVPASDPPLLLARVFADRLARAGVEIGGGIRRLDAARLDLESARVVAGTRTAIERVLARAMRRSLNMAAECLLLRAGGGRWDSGSRLMRRTLARQYRLDPRALRVSDGSGLSPENRVSPENMTSVLCAAAGTEKGRALLAALPRSGEKNTTLRRRMNTGPCRGRVAAKTGYISGVVGLSGYVLDREGRPAMAFSILVNDARSAAAAKKLADDVCAVLVGRVDATTRPARP